VSKFVKGPYFDPGNSGLLSEKVNVIHIDSFDVKWFGTDMGISRYDGVSWDTINTDSISLADGGKEAGLLNSYIRDMAYERTSHGHEVWVATDSGLSVLSYTVDGVSSATTYHTNHATVSDIINDSIRVVGVDSRHNRWIGTPAGISIYHGSDWADTTFFFSENLEWDAIPDVELTSAASYDKDSMIYITTHGAGVIRYQFDDIDGFTGASAYGEDWSGLLSNTVNTVKVVDTIQWIGSAEGAYWHTGNEVKPLSRWDYFDLGLISKSSNVTAIEVDNNGNVWFGTDSGLVIRTNTGWYE
jgi:ligand-binding sensor domain-containing protein